MDRTATTIRKKDESPDNTSPNALMPKCKSPADRTLRLTSSQQYMELMRAGDQKAIDQFLVNHSNSSDPVVEDAQKEDRCTTTTDATTLDDLGKQLENQEDPLIAITDQLGDLDVKCYELRAMVSKLPPAL